jgi:hypothetical protein
MNKNFQMGFFLTSIFLISSLFIYIFLLSFFIYREFYEYSPQIPMRLENQKKLKNDTNPM